MRLQKKVCGVGWGDCGDKEVKMRYFVFFVRVAHYPV